MVTVTFDTHEVVNRLKAAGFNEKQAEEVVRVVSEAQTHIVTREYLDTRLGGLEAKIDAKFAIMDAKFDKVSWMVGTLIALAVANFAKQFF